ncbi:hypothetical protein PDJAM_G00170780, partial [Pangasius djambal]|nr:hypothetical protein [Pangasius djambal]
FFPSLFRATFLCFALSYLCWGSFTLHLFFSLTPDHPRTSIMRPQPSVFLRALCLLLSTAPVFHEASASLNTTNVTATTMTYNKSATESASPTTTPQTNVTFPVETQGTSTISTASSETRSTTTTTVQSTASPSATSDAGTVVCLILFFCLLILLSFCFYKWYIRHGRPSCLEIWRRVTECARNSWAMAVECLRPSPKEEEVDEEMEAGITEAEEQKKQEEDAEDEDEDDDSSDNYSCVDGTVMMKKPKKDEEEDGRSSEDDDDDDDDMSSVELKDEKTEREKDDLTVL